jgi:hypothetical protein
MREGDVRALVEFAAHFAVQGVPGHTFGI